jgi:hypothetical protein
VQPVLAFKSANTILYCKKWQETVVFYRDNLGLPINFASDWFVEFHLGEQSLEVMMTNIQG